MSLVVGSCQQRPLNVTPLLPLTVQYCICHVQYSVSIVLHFSCASFA